MRTAGITLLEIVVLAVIIVASVGLVYPVVVSEIARTDRAAAEEQCRRIAVGLRRYLDDKAGDTVPFPADPATGQPLRWLRGPGDLPANLPFHQGVHGRIAQVLCEMEPSNPSWNGPYVEAVKADPWGHAYLVNTHGVHEPREGIWILSAGPNGVVETAPESPVIRGDDIGRKLR